MCDCNSQIVVDYTVGDSICVECGTVTSREYSFQASYIPENSTEDYQEITHDITPTHERQETVMYNKLYQNFPEIIGVRKKTNVMYVIHCVLNNITCSQKKDYKIIANIMKNIHS